MQSHYAIKGSIRYYRTLPTEVELPKAGSVKSAQANNTAMLAIAAAADINGLFDPSCWKDPPHIALANLQDKPAAVLRFTRTYGVLARNYRGEARTIPVRDVLRYRDRLRRAWDNVTDEQAFQDVVPSTKQAFLYPGPSGLEVVIEDLWTLICTLFARDMWDMRTKKCQNPDCPAPYFLAVRKGQKFCDQKCAVLINVRLFRERAAQRTAKKGNRQKNSPQSAQAKPAQESERPIRFPRKAVKPTKARKAS